MIDARALRDCLGQFATGVTVVTCCDARGDARGITANSFSSVSLSPPLVLWNIAKTSLSLQAFLASKHFGINVLSADQQSVSQHFAQSKPDLFADIPFELSPRSVPRVPATLARFECATRQIHDCGDHFIIVGEVLEFSTAGGEPLLFFGGQYRALADD